MFEESVALAGLDEVPWAELPLHSHTAEGIPELLRGLVDPVRGDNACWELDCTLLRQGSLSWPAATAALPFMARLAADERIACRVSIIDMLTALAARKPDDRRWAKAWSEAVPVLGMLLDDADPDVRQSVAEALACTDDVRGTIRRALLWRWAAETDRAVRLNLVFTVADLAPPGVEEWLVERLEDPDRQIRLAAASQLRPELRTEAMLDTVIFDAVSGPDIDIWREVNAVGLAPAGVITWLGAALGDLPARLRLVRTLIGHADPARRLGALSVAATLLNERRSVVPELLPLVAGVIDDSEVDIRALAVQLVAGLGPEASAHVDKLAALLDDESTAYGEVRFSDLAIWGLSRMGDSRCVAPLQARLAGERLGYSCYSVSFPRDGSRLIEVPGIHEVLAGLSCHANALVRGVGHRLISGDHLHAWRPFAEVITSWGPAAASAVTQVRPLLYSEAPCWAAEALAAIGPPAASTKRLLRGLAETAQPRHRWPAAGAYARVTGKHKLAAEILGRAVADSSTAERHTAARHLGTLGRAAAKHAGSLRALMAGDDPRERVEAAYALWQVKRDPCAVTTLLELVRTSKGFPPATRRAIKYLAAIKPLPPEAAPVLRSLLDRDDRLADSGSWRAFTENQEIRGHASAALANCS
jgi:HEAT repeat protein